MSDRPDSSKPSLQDEAQRLAAAARERAADAFEEIKLNSNQLVDKVRELIEEGNVRRISVRKGDRTLLEIPLTVGAGAAAAALLISPVLAGIGAVAALISEVTLVIERDGHPDVDLGDAADRAIDSARSAVEKATGRASGAAEGASPTSGSSDSGSGSGSAGNASGSGSSDSGSGGDASSKTMGRSDAGSGSGSGTSDADAGSTPGGNAP